MWGKIRRTKASCHAFCIRKSHASLPLPLSLSLGGVVVRKDIPPEHFDKLRSPYKHRIDSKVAAAPTFED
jgi:hypothetical protein